MDYQLKNIAVENLEAIVDFAIVNNRVKLEKDEKGNELIKHLPFTVLPYKVNAKSVKELEKTQEIWN